MVEHGYTICTVCQRQVSRYDTDLAFDTGACFLCFGRFAAESFEAWASRVRRENEVISGYLRCELAYQDEDDSGQLRDECGRCGDDYGWDIVAFIALPDDKQIVLCHYCIRDWETAADIETDTEVFMSPEAVSGFQWSGIESQFNRELQRWREREAVKDKQGGLCLDCQETISGLESAYPYEQTPGFIVLCWDCARRRDSLDD